MLVKFRQRVIGWFRAADYLPGGDQYEEPVEAREEPAKRSMAILGTSTRKYNNANTAKIRVSDDDELSSESISFQVFPAAGGLAIQVRSYDRVHDDRTTKLHVVPEDKDLAEALTHILSLESLRR